MHIGEDGSSTYVRSTKRLIPWDDITRLSIREFFYLSRVSPSSYFFFQRLTDLLRAGIRLSFLVL